MPGIWFPQWDYALKSFTEGRKSVNAPRPVAENELQEKEPAEIEWGAAMPTTIDTLPVLAYEIVDETEDTNEIERKTHEKRVENPDDPNQFVDVEVVDEIVFQRASGKRVRYILQNNE